MPIQWKPGGGILWKMGAGIAFDPACCCGGTTCTGCPPSDAPYSDTYTVVDVSELICSVCDSDTTDPPWDGVLYATHAGCWNWNANDGSYDNYSLNGRLMSTVDNTTLAFAYETSSPIDCRWILTITCSDSSLSTGHFVVPLWIGEKAWVPGDTPAGTYTFKPSKPSDGTPACGLTGPATLTVA